MRREVIRLVVAGADRRYRPGAVSLTDFIYLAISLIVFLTVIISIYSIFKRPFG